MSIAGVAFFQAHSLCVVTLYGINKAQYPTVIQSGLHQYPTQERLVTNAITVNPRHSTLEPLSKLRAQGYRGELIARTLPNDSCRAAFITANCAFSFSTLEGLANDSRAASSSIYEEEETRSSDRGAGSFGRCWGLWNYSITHEYRYLNRFDVEFSNIRLGLEKTFFDEQTRRARDTK